MTERIFISDLVSLLLLLLFFPSMSDQCPEHTTIKGRDGRAKDYEELMQVRRN